MVSDLKESIESLSYGVNTLLTEYVNIHTDIFAFSIRKVIPVPFIFKKIDYAYSHKTLKKISNELGEAIKEARNMLGHLDSSSIVYSYIERLKQYSLALMVTVDKLYNICYKMQSKIDGKTTYSKNDYDVDVNSYNESIKNYLLLGEPLNTNYREVILFLDQGSIQSTSVKVHLLDPLAGYEIQAWIVGKDIQPELVEKFKDNQGEIYAVKAYENGKPTTMVLIKTKWLEVKQQYELIG